MVSGDDKVQREILQQVYEKHTDSIRRRASFDSINEALDHIDREELIYQLTRMEDNRLIETRGGVGQRITGVSLTPTGVETLDQQGYETILQNDLRDSGESPYVA